MDKLNREILKNLLLKNSKPCISIYIPTHKEWNGTEQDMTRYKNILRKVEKSLLEKNYKQIQVDEILKESKKLLNERAYWNHLKEGLALFISTDDFKYFRLPVKFEEFFVISHRYHIKPLFQLLHGDGKFYLLALDKSKLAFYEGSKYELKEVKLPEGTPLSFKEAMKFEDDQNHFQYKTVTSANTGTGAGTRGGTYHGQGQGFDETLHKQKIVEFFQMVNKGVFSLIKDDNAPLILAGVEYLLPLYKKANTYSQLVDEGIKSDPQGLRSEELHQKAYEIVKPLFVKAEENSKAKYEQLSGEEKASSRIEEVVKAAYAKKVDSLFVDVNQHIWGGFDPANNEVYVNGNSKGTEDLLDLAAAFTHLNGGRVFAVERNRMPNRMEVAAVFRY